MLLTEKRSIIGICSYCVLDRPVFERCQTLLHPELTPWWSFLLADGAHHKKPHSPTHPQLGKWIWASEQVSNIGFITVHGLNEGHITPYIALKYSDSWIHGGPTMTQSNITWFCIQHHSHKRQSMGQKLSWQKTSFKPSWISRWR